MFVDKVQVVLAAGDGGDGAVSFRHEKFVDRGGPDGGDGGRGGHVVLVGDENMNTLVNFRYKQELKAESGQPGFKQRMHGKNGSNLLVKVPIGTVALVDGEVIADITEHGQEIIVAKGGDGGFGNAHFKSSTRQAPRVAEVGEKGEVREVTFELKLLADVGLVGFPNAGKSTFLSVVTNAKPEIADYPFTTLTPNLGVADFDGHSLLIADIPGLIEGASGGKGLGDAFLRHIERTAVLLHLIDIYEDDITKAYQTISDELRAYSPALAERPRIIVLTKTEGLDTAAIDERIATLRPAVPEEVAITSMSSQAHQGTLEVLRAAYSLVQDVRAKEAAEREADEAGDTEGLPVIELPQAEQDDAWSIEKTDDGRYVIRGIKIERFARRTDFANPHGVDRLRDIMRKTGVMHDLLRKGAKPDDTVQFGSDERHSFHL